MNTLLNLLIMEKKKQPDIPLETPNPSKTQEITPSLDPEEPLVIPPEEFPDLIPDEEFYEPPPYEISVPGEGP